MTKKVNKKNQFVIFLDNKEYPVSIELYEVYRILEREAPKKVKMIRVVDESGEDYYYLQRLIEPIEVPKPVREILSF